MPSLMELMQIWIFPKVNRVIYLQISINLYVHTFINKLCRGPFSTVLIGAVSMAIAKAAGNEFVKQCSQKGTGVG